MMQLFAQGIEDNKNLITDAITNAFGVQPQIAVNAQMNQPAQEIVVPRGNADSGRVIDVRLYLKDTEVGRTLVPILDNEKQRYGVKLATGGAY